MKLFRLLLVCFFVLGLLCSCEEAPPPAPQPAPPPQAPDPPQPVADTQEVPNGVTNPWPFVMPFDDVETALAQDWLARNYMLVFDGSGSMSGRRCSGGRPMIDVAREAVIDWLALLPAGAWVGMVAFHSQGWTEVPLSLDRNPLIQAINQIKPGRSTPLTRAFGDAFRELTRQGQRQLGYGEYTLVVVTDGFADYPDRLARRVDQILGISPVLIHTIGFCIGPEHSLNQPGRTIYKAADNPDDLRRGLQEVLAESDDADITAF